MRLAILTSHPIQYNAPLFRELAKHVDLKVFFAHRASWGRAVLFGLGVFGVMLFPVLGVFNMPYIGRSPVVTDHLQYLALIGIIPLVAAALVRAPRPVANPIVIVVVGACCLLSWRRG